MHSRFGPLPDFKQGQQPGEWSAQELQNLVSAVRTLIDMQGGPGIKVSINPAGATISSLAEEVAAKGGHRIKHVVVTSEPQETDDNLTVREVDFRSSPGPDDSAYVWLDADFECLPSFGYEAIDFVSFYKDPVEDPDIGWPILKCQITDTDQKLLWHPGESGGMKLCVIRGDIAEDNTDETVMVQAVRNGEITGAQYEMKVWPGQVAGDYRGLAWPGTDGPLNDLMNVLPAFLVDGEWRVMQYIKYHVGLVRGDTRIGGCSLVNNVPVG